MYLDLYLRMILVKNIYGIFDFAGYRIQRGVDQDPFFGFRGALVLPASGENQRTSQKKQGKYELLPIPTIPEIIF